jgi:uncharacterized membrane protein
MADILNRCCLYGLQANQKPKDTGTKEPSLRSAADILDERYAKGELTREQDMQMKKI